MKVYVDTNIFVDHLQKRSDKIRPLSCFAFECFSRGWNCAFKLVFSSWNRKELKGKVDEKELEELLTYFREKDKLIEVNYSPEDMRKAKENSNWPDHLHMIIATKNNCDKLVTRDWKDFSVFSSKIDIVYPENI